MTGEGGVWIVPHQITGIDQITINDVDGNPVVRFEAYRASLNGFEFGLILTSEAMERAGQRTPPPTIEAVATPAAAPLITECTGRIPVDETVSYEYVIRRIVGLSSLTLILAWPALGVRPTEIPVDIRAINDALHSSEVPPDHAPPGYSTNGKRIMPR